MKHIRCSALVLASFSLATLASAQGAGDIFEEHNFTWLSEHRRIEYPADLDGDGKDEIVGWWNYSSSQGSVQIFFWTQDGATGTWTEKESTTASGTGAYSWDTATAIGDFDADGKEEMAVLHHWGIEVWEPSANGEPMRIIDQDYSPNIPALDRDCTVLDFDNDGRDDIVLTASPDIYMFRSVPGGFVLTDSYTTTGGDLSVLTTDAEGDPELEIVVLQDRVTPNVLVFPLQGMQFMAPRPYLLQQGVGGHHSDAVHITCGDVDNDGDEDLVLFGMGGFYQVMRRDTSGYLIESPLVGGPADDLADFNGDGNLDGICCGGGSGSSLYNDQPSTFHVCVGDGTGGFDTSVQFAGMGAHHIAGAIDFDDDGDLDLVAGRTVLFNRTTIGRTYCDSSANSSGNMAELHASGRHSKQAGGALLTGTNFPASTVAILMAANLNDPNLAVSQPFWDGTLCMTGYLGRLRIVVTDASGAVDFGGATTWNQVWPHVGFGADNNYAFQSWFRDQAAGLSGANVSSALHAFIVK
jgi:hypothetical protein